MGRGFLQRCYTLDLQQLSLRLVVSSDVGGKNRRQVNAMNEKTKAWLMSKYSLWENTDFFVGIFVRKSIKKVQQNTDEAIRHGGKK